MEIVGVDFDSGLKMGLSGISGFGAIESGGRWVQRSFSTANVLVNLLVKEAVEGLSTLLTGYLSRLVSGLERGLLHRSVAHCWSAFYGPWAAVNLLLSEYGRLTRCRGVIRGILRSGSARRATRVDPRAPSKIHDFVQGIIVKVGSKNRFQEPIPKMVSDC